MKSLLKLRPYLRPFRWHLLGSALLAIPLSALRLSPAPLVKVLVDDLLVHRDTARLLLFPVAVILVYAINFVVRFFHYYLLRVAIARVNENLKVDLYNHLLGLSADYFTHQSSGQLISRVASDPQYIDSGLSVLNTVIREPVTFVFLFGYACSLNWKLTLISLIVFPFLGWVFSATNRNMKRYIQRMTDENGSIFSALNESFQGIRVVQAFGIEKYTRGRFQERVGNWVEFFLKTARVEEASHPAVELLTAFAVAGVFYYGGLEVLNDRMTAGDLLAFFTSFAMMMHPIRMMNDVNIRVTQMIAATDRIFEVFSWKSRLVEKANAAVLSDLRGEIAFERVQFHYPDAPEREILKGITLHAKRGQTVGIVGSSGSGKSSLVNLLPRIFDVVAGKILIDGRDIRDFQLESLRSKIAIVGQDVFLFNDTVEVNIRCGRLDATFDEIVEAAKMAHAWEFISKLPQGLNTVVGDRGSKLSGGERQRISIARAFLKRAPILILDEATSNLDNESERIVQEAISDLMKDRTTLLIAHRLSTVQNADTIVVVESGQVVETGTHTELMKQQGVYARYYELGQRDNSSPGLFQTK